MLSKYWKNTVLTSHVDHYCLVCESLLRSLDDVDAHIDKPVHRKKLDSTSYFEKHADEKIRQVPSGYYCEACNLLFATTNKVNLHVGELNHMSNLGLYHLKRSGNSVLAFNNIVIDDKAWNGFIDNTCVICDQDFTNESIHKNEKKHILNLVQSKIDFGDGKSVYRLIDHASQQCLTCNYVFSTTSTHFDSSDHKEKYEICRSLNAPNNEKANIIVTETDNKKTKKKNKKHSVQEDEISTTPAAASNGKNTNGNIADGENDSDDDYLRNILGAKDYIIKKDDKNICMVCDWVFNPGMSVDDHVNSTHHLTLVKLHKKRLSLQKKPGKGDTDEHDDDAEIVENDDTIDKILEATSDFAKERIEINLERRTATCKKCSDDLDFDDVFIKRHIEEHKKKENKKSQASKFDLKDKDEFQSKTLYTKPVTMKTKEQNEPAAVVNDEMTNFAKKHDLVFKNNKYFCSVCCLSLTPKLETLKGHIVTTAHKNRLARLTKAPSKSFALRIPLKDFIKTTNMIETVYSKDVVINDKLCVNILSFYMFTKQDFKLRCQPCGVTFDFDHADIHKINDRHEDYMRDTLVVSSLKDEFVREVPNGALHCGFCNLVVDSDNMEKHLDSTSHKESKRSAQSRLERYLPEIAQGRQQRAAEVMFLKMLAGVNGFPF